MTKLDYVDYNETMYGIDYSGLLFQEFDSIASMLDKRKSLLMHQAIKVSLIAAALGSTSNLAIRAQSLSVSSHPEIVQAVTCRDLTLNAIREGFFGTGQVLFGLPTRGWTKQDLRQLKVKFDDCNEQSHPSSSVALGNIVGTEDTRQKSVRHTSDLIFESQMQRARDPEADAQKAAEGQRLAAQRQQDVEAQQAEARITAAAEQAARQRRAAERQRMEAEAQEKANVQALANQAEDQRRAAERQQRLATAAAQARAAEVEAQAQDLRNQQAAADQSARDRKQQAATQAAADQAAAERLVKGRRDQVIAEAAAEEAIQKMPKPLTVDCTQAAMLTQVQKLLAKRTDVQVFKIYNPEPNPAFNAYLAAPALERVKMSKQIFAVPQCYAMAMTSSGETPIAFRVFTADGDPYIEITDRIVQ